MTDEIIPGIKLCCDCRFFLSEDEKCGHASALVIDYVHGNHRRFFASAQRFSSRDCGVEAVHFEPRRIDNVIGAAERFAQPCDVEAAE